MSDSAAFVIVTRGSLAESVHRVHIAAVNAQDRLVAFSGNPVFPTFARSTAKPLQAVPLLEFGAARQFRLSDEEVAVVCGSHSGEDFHVNTVQSILSKLGIDEDSLLCGAHSPFHQPTVERMRERQEEPTRIHNNCSGKHAGMLALGTYLKADLKSYVSLSSPVQQNILQTIAEMSGISASLIHLGIDGCGVPVFGLPIDRLAYAFARLADPAGLSAKREEACRRIIASIRKYPAYLAGTDRFDTCLIAATNGRIIGKSGAEGIFALIVPEKGLGIVVKVEDGSGRAVFPAVMETLMQLNLLHDKEYEKLRTFHQTSIHNWAGIEVGQVKPEIALQTNEGGKKLVEAVGEEQLLKGDFWRQHALTELIPLWHDHARDTAFGAFHMNLSRDWRPIQPWDKAPAMIGRHIYSFSAAYLLSGEDKYAEAAREGVEYLLEHAWDREYGGWFETLTQTGEPKDTSKNIPSQLYTNVGLAMYYFTTGDERALSHLYDSMKIQRTHGHDKEFGGYYQALNRDLTVKDAGKNKHAHYGYVSSLLLNLQLATRNPEVLKWGCELEDLTLERMTDPQEGWARGNPDRFGREWIHYPAVTGESFGNLFPEGEGIEYVSIGAQLTAALSFLRLFHQTGNSAYLDYGKALADKINRIGWDPEQKIWREFVERTAPFRAPASSNVVWWVHIYGAFLQLQLYALTRNEAYLTRFCETESFFFRHFVDWEHGGVFKAVSTDGTWTDNGSKSALWQVSYHEVEHALLNYLYIGAYVNQEPVVLHFKLDSKEHGQKHYVSLFDDPSVEITSVNINGEPWKEFDAQERSVTLPRGNALRLEVALRLSV